MSRLHLIIYVFFFLSFTTTVQENKVEENDQEKATNNNVAEVPKKKLESITSIYRIPLGSPPAVIEKFMLERGYEKDSVDEKTGTLVYNRVRIGGIPSRNIFFIFRDKQLFSVNIVWTLTKSYANSLKYFNAINERLNFKYGKSSVNRDDKIDYHGKMITEYKRVWKLHHKKMNKNYMLSLSLRYSNKEMDEDFVKTPDWSLMNDDDDETGEEQEESKEEISKTRDNIKVEQLYTYYSVEDFFLEDF